MTDADLPASIIRFRQDLERLTGVPGRLGIAVSGGGDSLALLRLASLAYPGSVEAATVDHGLRPESADEARHVARICAALGCPHATLSVHVEEAGEGLQAAARNARYAALEAWARGRGLPLLLTAHHADDQAETLLMRLARGAGLAGLAGVRALRPLLPGLTLVRPLLGWRRADLAVIAAPLAPIDDPSNANQRFDRVRMRTFLAGRAALDSLALSRSAAALAESEQAIEWAVEQAWTARVTEVGPALTFDPAELPAEIRRRLVVRLLARFSGQAPRGDEVQRLLRALEAGSRSTLAGVKCSGGAIWLFETAPPRRLNG